MRVTTVFLAILLSIGAAQAITINVRDATTNNSLNATVTVTTLPFNVNITYDLSTTDENSWFSGTMKGLSAYNGTAVYLSSSASVGRFGVYNPVTNVSYDLSSTDTGDWIGAAAIEALSAYNDSAVYLVGQNNKLGVYDPITNVTTQITQVGTSNRLRAVDAYNATAVYVAGDAGQYRFYNPSNGLTTDLNATDPGDWIGASASLLGINAYNSTAVYLAGNGGKLGVYNPVTNITYDLSSTDPLDWMGTETIFGISAYNSTAVYVGLTSGKFGVYNPSTNITYELTSSDVGNWIGTTTILSVHAQNSTAVYLGIGSGKFGFYNPVTNLSYDLSATDAAGWIGTNALQAVDAFNSSAVYMTISSTKFGVYDPSYIDSTTASYNLSSGTVTVSYDSYRFANITASAAGYGSVTAASVNLSLSPYIFNLTSVSNITFTLLDEATGRVINTTTTTLSLSSSTYGVNATSTNGTFRFENLSYDYYTVTYSGTNYTQRQIFAYLPSASSANYTLYLLNDTSATLVLFTVLDQTYSVLNGVVVTALNKNLSGTNYYSVAQCTTDLNGECLMGLQLYTSTYRFLTEYNGVVRNSSDTVLSRNTYTIVLNTQSSTLQNVLNRNDLSASLVYTPTGRFDYTVVDSSGDVQSGLLTIERRYGGRLYSVSSTTGSGSSFIITATGVNVSLGDEIVANGYVYIDGQPILTHSISVIDSTAGGSLGSGMAFLFLGMMFTIVFIFAWNPVAPLIAFGAFVLIMSRIGIIGFGTGAVVAVIVVIGVAIYRMRSV